MQFRLIFLLTFFLFSSATVFSANFFWVDGPGNWSDGAHWSNISGGGPIAAIPTATDNVIFDDGSGLVPGDIVNMDIAISVVDFDFSAMTNAFTLSSALGSIEITGSLSASGLAIIAFTSDINMNPTVVGNVILSNGQVWSNDFYFVSANDIALSDNFSTSGDLHVVDGGLITSGVQVDCLNFFANTANTRSIDISNSTFNLTGTDWNIDPTTLTWTGTGSTINFLNLGTVTLTGGALTYGDIISSAATFEIFDDNVFGLIELSASSSFLLENSSSQQLDSLSSFGSCGSTTVIDVINPGQPAASIEKTGYSIFTSNNLSISKVNAVIGGGQIYNISFSDTTNASNWTFVGTNYFWRGGAGDWNDVNNWSFTTGGAIAGCIPNSEDSVFFDVNSFSGPNQIVNVDADAYFAYMDWTGSTNNPVFNLSADVYSYGDIHLQNNMSVTKSSFTVKIEFKRQGDFDPMNAPVACNIAINLDDDSELITQTSDLNQDETAGLYLMRGGYNSNSNTIYSGLIAVVEVSALDLKYLDFGASNITLLSGFSSDNVTSNFTFVAGSSELNIGSENNLNYLLTEDLSFYNVTLDFYEAASAQSISGNNNFNKLKILKGSYIEIESSSTQTVLDSLTLIGNCIDSIYLNSSTSGVAANISKAIATDVIAECLELEDISASNTPLTTVYSTDNGGNTGWTFGATSPVISNFTADGPFCIGDTTLFTDLSISVTGDPNDVTSYWYFDDGSTGYWNVTSPTDSNWVNYEIDTLQHEFITGGDFDVMLVNEFINFCVDTFIVNVHINDPSIFMSSSDLDKEICEGEEVTLEASSSTVGAEFEFFLNNVSQNTPSINDTLYITSTLVNLDTVSVVAYENGCISDTIPAFGFTVFDAPIFTWSSTELDNAICAEENVTFSANSGDPTYTYQFLINDIAQTAYSTTTDYSTSTLNNGDVIGVVAQNTDGCTDSLDVTFTIHPLPVMTLDDDVAGNVICDGQNVTFTATGADSYEFFIDGVSQGNQATGVFSTNSLQTGNVVSVIGTTTELCNDGAPNTFSYTVNTLPTINLSINPDTIICSGETVNFSLSGGTEYEMFINNVSQGAATPTSIFSSSTINDGDFIYFEGGFSGCVNQSDTVSFDVFVSPTTTLTSSPISTTICQNEEVTFTANGADNYEFFIDGVSQGPASPTATFSTSNLSDNQLVSVAGESNTCIIDQSITFDVLPIPSVNLFSNDPNDTICEGGSILFTSVNANTYEFFINNVSQGAPSTTSTLSPTLAVGMNEIYTIGTASNGCSDTSVITLSIQVNPLPTVTIISDAPSNTICEGDMVIFTGDGSDQYQFFLDGVSQGSMSSNNSYTNDNLNNGQVISISGSSLGCSNPGNSVTMTVFSIPNVSLTSPDIDNIFCELSPIDYTASGAGQYEFFLDNISQGAPSTVDIYSTSGLLPGNYNLQVIGGVSACLDSAEVDFTINATPIATLASSDPNDSICSGDLVTFTGGGGALYEFFINGVSQGDYSPLNEFQLTNLLDGDIVSVSITDATGCTNSTAHPAMTVFSTPNVIISSSEPDLEICVGDNIDFNSSGADEYEFFLNGVSQGGLSPTSSYSNSTLNDGDIVNVYGIVNGCPAFSADLEIIVHNYPTVALLNNDDLNLCTGELTDLIATGADNYQFLINGTPAGGFTPTDVFNSSLNNGDEVSVIGDLFGCQSTAPETFTYSVSTYPNLISSASPGTTVCVESPVTVSATGGATFEFQINGVIEQSGASSSFTTEDLENGDQIMVTSYNDDCPSTPDTYTFIVNEMNLDLSITPSTLVCEGESVSFTATGGNQYEFFINGISQGPMSATNTFTSSTLNDQDEVTFDAYSASTGCTQSYSATAVMNILAEPTISPLSSTTICDGDSVILVSNASYGNQWYIDNSPISGATDTSYVAYVGGDYSLEVTAGGNGELWSFGNNSTGIYGNATNVGGDTPTMSTTTAIFDEIASGYLFMMGVTPLGELYAWGDNEYGQLGDGTFADSDIPQIISSVTDVKTIATANESSMAVTNSGDVYVWGKNNLGQLGTGTLGVINFPFQNSILSNVDSIAAGKEHFIVLKNDGTVWGMGLNDYGQLGQGDFANASTPEQISGLSNVVHIGAGEHHSFAIDNNGDLYVWGNNGSGQLGLGDLSNRLIPTLSPIRDVVDAQGGAAHSLFLTSENKVLASGENSYGQLGIGNTTNSNVAEEMLLGGAVQISTAEYTSIIRNFDNSVYVSGNNNVNQLSSETGTIVMTPELVPDVDGVTFIEANPTSTHFIFGEGKTCFSASITVTQLTAPVVTIAIDSNTLVASEAGVGYQWYLNGLPIPGANSQSYEALVSGDYFVEVTFANGCVSESNEIYHGMADVSELNLFDFVLYPNPVNDIIHIQFKDDFNEEVKILIYDALGRKVSESIPYNSQEIFISIDYLEQGIYQLVIQHNNGNSAKQFIKSNL